MTLRLFLVSLALCSALPARNPSPNRLEIYTHSRSRPSCNKQPYANGCKCAHKWECGSDLCIAPGICSGPTPPSPRPPTPPPIPPTPSPSPRLPPVGLSAWVYDYTAGPGSQAGPAAMWAEWIESFNNGTGSDIKTVYAYGGDMEYYPEDIKNPTQTYLSAASIQEIQKYRKVPGVKQVIAVVDGRQDGTQDWAPDLSKLTKWEVDLWAARTAWLYCSYPEIDGLQIDLEPAGGKYQPNLVVFLAGLGRRLADDTANCKTPSHPNGRSLGVFMFPADVTPEVYTALGPNGYVVASGYDLGPNPAGDPNTPSAYQGLLTTALQTMISAAEKAGGSFVVGIPASASAHEFESAIGKDKNVTTGVQQVEYLKAARAAFDASGVDKAAGYRGAALWGFSVGSHFPNQAAPADAIYFHPSNPLADDERARYIATNF